MKWTKIIMIIGLLLCLGNMPYGYYMLVRVAATILFGILAFDYYGKEQQGFMVGCIILAALFQPLVRLPIGREMWGVVDIAAAIFLGATMFGHKKEKEQENT